MITLSKLRGFHAVATLGSFREAARELGRTQPALTAQVADLESTLGISLLERTTRRVRLTSEGQRFLTRTRSAIEEIDAAVDEIKELVTLERGQVSMGCLPSVAAYLIPDVLASFSQEYPGIAIRYFDEPTTTLVERLKNREIDFYIGPKPIDEPDIRFNQLYDDRFVVVFPERHKFSKRRSVKLEDALAEVQVGMAKGTNVRTVLDRCFDRLGITYTPLLEAQHHFTLGGMVQSSLGVTLLPFRALPLLSHAQLKWCDISDQRIDRAIGVCTHRSRRLMPAATMFIDMIRPGLFAAIDESGAGANPGAKQAAREKP